MRKNLTIFIVTAAAVAFLTIATAAPQDKGAPPPPAKGKAGGRGGKKGPAGPLPRLSDGKPDLTGVWNGFGGSGNDAPNMQPWAAKVVADHRAAGGAEDYEARCLPGGPPRAAPYHTSFFATPKLVLMLFEGNTHMYRQFFVDGSSHPTNLKPAFYGDSRAHWNGDTLVVDTVSFFDKSWYDFAGHSAHQGHAPDRGIPSPRFRQHGDESHHRRSRTLRPDPGSSTGPHRLRPDFDMTEYVCNENNQDPGHLDGHAGLGGCAGTSA